jgi:ABC-type uncharacterized transport system permease subunit
MRRAVGAGEMRQSMHPVPVASLDKRAQRIVLWRMRIPCRLILLLGLLVVMLCGCVMSRTRQGSSFGLIGVQEIKAERQKQAQSNFESDLGKKSGSGGR